MKSTKILSADDVVTNKKVGQKYDIVQKYDNIRFYPYDYSLLSSAVFLVVISLRPSPLGGYENRGPPSFTVEGTYQGGDVASHCHFSGQNLRWRRGRPQETYHLPSLNYR